MDLTLILTIGTPLLIVMYIVRSDKFPEPTNLIIKTFFVGVFLCFPAGYLNSYISLTEQNLGFDMSFMAGFTEEPLKFLAFMLFVRPKTDFNEPMDAIVYGTIISLGFATYENIEYVYLYNEEYSSLSIATIRAFSAIPLHASCGIIMGYYIGLYTFKGDKKHIVQALAIPVFIHAFYNYLTAFSGIFFFAYLSLVIYFANKLDIILALEQSYKTIEKESKFK